jgi:tetratricopeptide (TPR) repeat protein
MVRYIKPSIIILISFLLSCSPYSLPEPEEKPPREDAFAYYQESMQNFNDGNYESALENIQAAIKIHQNFANFYKMEGDVYNQMAKYDLALKSYESAITQRSNFIEVHQKMAEIYFKHGRYDEAIRSFRKVLVLEPEETDMYLRIAQCFIALDELEIALNNLTDYTKNEKNYSGDYYLLKGIAYYNLRRYSDVIDELHQFEDQIDASTDLLYLLGRSYYGIKDYDNGLKCFNKLIQKDATQGEYFFYRAIYFFVKENYSDAEMQFKYALELDSSIAMAHYYLGQIYGIKWQVDKALEEFSLFQQKKKDSEDEEEIDDLISQLQQLRVLVSDSTRNP